jgi:hypothetical protein
MHRGELKRNVPIQKNRLLFREEVSCICIFGAPKGKRQKKVLKSNGHNGI